jgi:metallo-beta-lactamase family protein
MEISLFGAAKTVTGSCYSIKTNEKNILVDCGMFQGGKDQEKLNYGEFGFNPKDYDVLLLTHAHLDHCGRIPKLVNLGFKGKIYCTSSTKELAKVIMLDAANIAKHDIENENKRRVLQGLPERSPIYTEDDVKKAMTLFEDVEHHQDIKLGKNIIARFYDAGHILGASFLQLSITEKNKKTKIVFSGDLGQVGTPIVKEIEFIQEADYVFIESTYGDRLHLPVEERRNEFLRIIHETNKKNGNLLIPSFAIERAQELLYDLNEFIEKGMMPKIRVYLDSPMAIKATEIFKKHYEDYNDEVKAIMDSGDNPFHFPGLVYSESVDDSKKINEEKKQYIVIAGSGMCTAGRIKHHILNNIENPKNTILFVGYQVPGTLGYWIKKGEKKVKLLGKVASVNAKVESIDSFSGHADYKGLLEWLGYFYPRPKKVFITHGEEKVAKEFAKKVEKLGIKTYIPSQGEKLVI